MCGFELKMTFSFFPHIRCRIQMSDVMENKKVAKEAEFGDFLEMLVDWIKAKKNMFKKEKLLIIKFG